MRRYDGHANHLHPTPFGDADVNAFKKGNFLRRRHVPLRRQVDRVPWVDSNADVGQLSLEERHDLHPVRGYFHHANAYIVQVGERFYPSFSNSSRVRFSTGRSGMQNNAGPMASPCCTPLEQSILHLFPDFIWKTRLQISRRNIRRRTAWVPASKWPPPRAPPSGMLKHVGAFREDQPVFCLVVHPGA